MHNNISAIAHHTSKPFEVIIKIQVKENNIIENIFLTKWYGKTFSHTDLMKQPCLAVKACQQHKYLIVLYIEKSLKHNINRMRGLIKLNPDTLKLMHLGFDLVPSCYKLEMEWHAQRIQLQTTPF